MVSIQAHNLEGLGLVWEDARPSFEWIKDKDPRKDRIFRRPEKMTAQLFLM